MGYKNFTLLSVLFFCSFFSFSQKLHQAFERQDYGTILSFLDKKGVNGINNVTECKDVAVVALWAGRYGEAVKLYRKALSLNENALTREDSRNYAFALIHEGRFKEFVNDPFFADNKDFWITLLVDATLRAINDNDTVYSAEKWSMLNLPGLIPQYGFTTQGNKIIYSKPKYAATDSLKSVLEHFVINSRYGELTDIAAVSLDKTASGEIATKKARVDIPLKTYSRIATANYVGPDTLFYTEVPLNGKPEKIKAIDGFKKFPFNSNKYACAMPFYDQRADRLYFCSQMPGGYGGWDVYYSDWRNGEWSKPVNLGDKVNTPLNEIFPSINNNGDLVFSSDGRDGAGGFDNYIFYFEDNTTVNLAMYNSELDDYCFRSLETDTEEYVLTMRGNDAVGFYTRKGAVVPEKKDIPEIAAKLPVVAEGLTKDTLKLINRFDAEQYLVIYYDVDSFRIKEKYDGLLDKFVDLLSSIDVGTVFIRSYTDPDGNTRYNDYLSYLRAEGVNKYLVDRLGKSFGEKVTMLVAGEKYASGKNKKEERKTEMMISDDKPQYNLLYAYKIGQGHDLVEVANLFHNNLSYLREINKTEDDKLPADGVVLVGIRALHKVKESDTMYNIAKRYGSAVEDIKNVNRKSDNTIVLGEKLIIPLGKNNREGVKTGELISENRTQKNLLYSYKSEQGQTLAEIASLFHNSLSYLREINKTEQDKLPADGVVLVEIRASHKVREFDTLYNIAKRYGSTVEDIKNVNRKADNIIVLGEKLIIPLGRNNRERVKTGELISENRAQKNLLYPYKIEQGQTLSEVASLFHNNLPYLREINKTEQDELPADGVVLVEIQTLHTVKEFDTLYNIAKRYGSTVEGIKNINRKADNTILLGEQLIIPLSN
ncbi:LysM peptidoglycan-binding domain-containing protein [Gaoshiqia sp. Z1-71]|uniref:LysM peptidoglycan-binding domain-containing protein n=1 Tax=Gaoshiqia hydrogeniformans TaxID=3290090 RepID=UPI003BF8B27E